MRRMIRAFVLSPKKKEVIEAKISTKTSGLLNFFRKVIRGPTRLLLKGRFSPN